MVAATKPMLTNPSAGALALKLGRQCEHYAHAAMRVGARLGLASNRPSVQSAGPGHSSYPDEGNAPSATSGTVVT